MRALVVDQPPASLELPVHREAEIKDAADESDRDREGDQLGARVDLADEFASELAQEDFRIVASRRCRRFNCRRFDKRRNVGFTRAGGTTAGSARTG